MKMKLLLFVALFAVSSVSFGQKTLSWDKWKWLIGNWTGEGIGQPGQGNGKFAFSVNLDSNIIVRKSHSEYPATEKKPAIIHDDLMIIYPETAGSQKAIYFDNEGHIINYLIEYAEKTIVFTSEKTSDDPVFRLTYSLLDDGMVNTKFEMSQDGANFITCIEGKSKKVK
jgi:hypothetical protein